MSDPIFIPGADKIAAAAADTASTLFSRAFGPSADTLGVHLAGKLDSRLKNAERVAAQAASRSRNLSEGVSPRVGASVLDGAQWAEDEVVADYLSGVLASSMLPDAGDRGVPWSALIGRMSSDALRLHHVMFSIVRQVQMTETVEFNQVFDDAVYVPATQLLRATGWDRASFGSRVVEVAGLLVREALIYDQFTFGDSGLFESVYPESKFPDPHGGFIFAPTQAGVDLFLWGLGAGGTSIAGFADPELELRTADGLLVPGDALGVGYLKQFTEPKTRVNETFRGKN